MINRKVRKLDGFWPHGTEHTILFVDVVGEEGQEIGGEPKLGKNKTKIGVSSKYNLKEAELVVRFFTSKLAVIH